MVIGIQTQVLVLTQGVLYQLGHLPSLLWRFCCFIEIVLLHRLILFSTGFPQSLCWVTGIWAILSDWLKVGQSYQCHKTVINVWVIPGLEFDGSLLPWELFIFPWFLLSRNVVHSEHLTFDTVKLWAFIWGEKSLNWWNGSVSKRFLTSLPEPTW